MLINSNLEFLNNLSISSRPHLLVCSMLLNVIESGARIEMTRNHLVNRFGLAQSTVAINKPTQNEPPQANRCHLMAKINHEFES